MAIPKWPEEKAFSSYPGIPSERASAWGTMSPPQRGGPAFQGAGAGSASKHRRSHQLPGPWSTVSELKFRTWCWAGLAGAAWRLEHGKREERKVSTSKWCHLLTQSPSVVTSLQVGQARALQAALLSPALAETAAAQLHVRGPEARRMQACIQLCKAEQAIGWNCYSRGSRLWGHIHLRDLLQHRPLPPPPEQLNQQRVCGTRGGREHRWLVRFYY